MGGRGVSCTILHGIQNAVTNVEATVIREQGAREDDSTEPSGGVSATDDIVLELGASRSFFAC